MRKIKYIVIHCTATQPTATVQAIQNYWRNNLGWKNPGYHFIIDNEGNVTQLLRLSSIANGVRGYNSQSIHLSYIGGIDLSGQPKDTRNECQLEAMETLVRRLALQFPTAKIQGHRDFPNVNKSCPSFDVSEYLKEIFP